MSQRDPLVGEIRIRLPLPLVIPVGALLLIAAVTILFSRVLLNLTPEAATAVALVTALNLLGACAFIALRPKLHRTALVELLLVISYPILIGAVLTQVDIGDQAATAPVAGVGEEAGATGTGELIAQDIAFNTDALTIEAGKEATVALTNDDSAQHNFSVYTNEAATKSLFEGEIVEPGGSIEYTFTIDKPGKYFFRCDLHPTAMTGELIAE